MSTPNLQTILNCLHRGQLSEAEQLCQQRYAAHPHEVDALQLLAIIYAQTKRFELAETYFVQAIALAPARLDIHGNYGNLLYECQRFDEAIQHCQLALDQASPRAEVFNTLGNALYKTEQFTEALNFYQQAIALQPNYPEAHNNLGQAFRALGNYAESERCFRLALSLRPDYAAAITNLQTVDSLWLNPLATDCVRLQRYRATDTDFLWLCYCDSAFMQLYNRFTPAPASKTALKEKLRQEENLHPLKQKAVHWVVSTRANDNSWQPIAIASLVNIDLSHRRAEYLIGTPFPEERNQRAGPTATLLVLDLVFNRLGFNKLLTLVYSDNEYSQRNCIAQGFNAEGLLRDQLWDASSKQYLSLYSNSMTLSDFRSNRRLAKLSQRLLGRDVTHANQP